LASGNRLDTATPADDPNQIMEPPNPTAYASTPQSYPPCSSASRVSGMLSNTAETTPRPKVPGALASGSRSTGIMDAASTSDSRNTLPLIASGNTLQSGRRHGVSSNSSP